MVIPMQILTTIGYTFAYAVTGLLIAPLLDGFRRVVKARIQRRLGPSILQTFYDIRKLIKLGALAVSDNSLVIGVPYMVFSLSILVTTLIPIPYLPGLNQYFGAISLVYTLMLITALTCLAGLMIPNPYSNAGSIRELLIVSSFELFTAFTIAELSTKLRTLNLYGLATSLLSPVRYLKPSTIILAISLYLLAYIEGGWTPFDIPEAETEVMGGPLLEYGGKLYALMYWSNLMKKYALVGLCITLTIMPPIVSAYSSRLPLVAVPALSYVTYIVFTIIMFSLFSAIEALNPRYRIDQIPRAFLALSVIPLTGLVLGWCGW